MNVTEIKYDFKDLALSPDMIEQVMGYKNQKAPEPIPGIIEEVIGEAEEFSDIKGGYTLGGDVQVYPDSQVIMFQDREFLTGKIITSNFTRAEGALLFLFTAGKQYEIRSRQQLQNSDQIKGYITDVLGSIIVELAVEKMQDELEAEQNNSGYNITNRYGPGYCGWPVSDQEKLFSFFPEGFAGISLSESSMMNPIKSVSGIIGIGREIRKTAYHCNICDDRNCIYRNLLHRS